MLLPLLWPSSSPSTRSVPFLQGRRTRLPLMVSHILRNKYYLLHSFTSALPFQPGFSWWSGAISAMIARPLTLKVMFLVSELTHAPGTKISHSSTKTAASAARIIFSFLFFFFEKEAFEKIMANPLSSGIVKESFMTDVTWAKPDSARGTGEVFPGWSFSSWGKHCSVPVWLASQQSPFWLWAGAASSLHAWLLPELGPRCDCLLVPPLRARPPADLRLQQVRTAWCWGL